MQYPQHDPLLDLTEQERKRRRDFMNCVERLRQMHIPNVNVGSFLDAYMKARGTHVAAKKMGRPGIIYRKFHRTPEIVGRIKELVKGGKCIRAIAVDVHSTSTTVLKICRDNGWKPRKGNRRKQHGQGNK